MGARRLRVVELRRDLHVRRRGPEREASVRGDRARGVRLAREALDVDPTSLGALDVVTAELGNGEDSKRVVEELKGAKFVVDKVDRKERKKNPLAPFIT